MKAILNLNGEKLEVANINLYKGKVENVQVNNGNNVFKTYYNEKSNTFHEAALLINMEESLEFPELEERIVDERNKLIAHLDEIINSENEYLTAFAIESMEDESLPFSDLALVNSQKEYKLMQQRVLGFIDAVEEVKAFTEGYYADKNNDGPIEAEIDHTAVE